MKGPQRSTWRSSPGCVYSVVEGGNGALLSLPSGQGDTRGPAAGSGPGRLGAGLVQASGVPWSAGVGSSGVRVSCGRVGWGFLCEVTLSVGALCFSVVPTVLLFALHWLWWGCWWGLSVSWTDAGSSCACVCLCLCVWVWVCNLGHKYPYVLSLPQTDPPFVIVHCPSPILVCRPWWSSLGREMRLSCSVGT